MKMQITIAMDNPLFVENAGWELNHIFNGLMERIPGEKRDSFRGLNFPILDSGDNHVGTLVVNG